MITSIGSLLSILTVIGDILAVLFVIMLLFGKVSLVARLSFRRIMWLMFIIALIATCGSLFYSEIVHYEPCKLCWFQRIFMYPQILLLGLALWKRDNRIFDYILWLSLIGMLIAGYHYLLQLGIVSGGFCGTVGYSVSCAQRFVMEYGYITIPMMAFTAFTLNFLLGLASKLLPRTEA